MQYQRGSIGLFFRGDPTLLGWWDFEQGSTDKTGHGYNGIDTAVTYSPLNNKFGQAGLFDGSSSKIILPINPSTQLSGDFTVMAFALSTAANLDDWKPVIGDSGVYAWTFGGVSGNQAQLFVNFCGAYNNAINLPTPLNDRRWHHIAVVKSGSNLFVYHNGIYIISLSGATGPAPTGSRIGENDRANPEYWKGAIDEVAIFSRALSPQEIAQYYKWATSPRPKYTLMHLPTPSSFFLFFNN